MSFQKSIEICFAKYATFSGKAGRSEYWWFFLFLILPDVMSPVLQMRINGKL